MVKTILLSLVLLTTLSFTKNPSSLLKENCLNCHQEQKIPSELIYRRYLLKYSTHTAIQQTLFEYLKNPTKETSIMPKQFFLKFPEKKALDLNETALQESIEEYLDYFDVGEKLVLP